MTGPSALEMVRVLPRVHRLLWLILCAVCTACAPEAPVERPLLGPLEPGGAYTHELPPGTTHRFPVDLAVGEALRTDVHQLGADVVLELVDPSGELQLSIDSPNGPHGPESLAFLATRAGRHTLKIQGIDSEITGNYRLEVLSLGPATALDQRLASALQAYREGETLRHDPDTRQAAFDAHCWAHDAWLADEPVLAARALRRMAQIHQARGELTAALHTLDRARPTFEALDAGWEVTALWNAMGHLHKQLGDPQRARHYYERSLERSRTVDNLSGVATASNNLAVLMAHLGRHEEALTLYRQTLDTWRTLGKHGFEATALHNIGLALIALGRPADGLVPVEEGLAIHRQTGSPLDVAGSLVGLAWGQFSNGDATHALPHLHEAIAIHRTAGQRLILADALDLLGLVHLELDAPESAREAFEQAVDLRRIAGYRVAEALSLVHLGRAERQLGQLAEARRFQHRALALLEALDHGVGQAMALGELARVADAAGDLHRAADLFERSLRRVETARGRLMGRAFRQSFFASNFSDIHDHVDLLLRLDLQEPGQGHDRRAFAVAERLRARALLDILSTDRGWLRRADPELLRQLRAVHDEIRAKEALRLASTEPSSAETSLEDLLAAERRLDAELRRSAGLDPQRTVLTLETLQAQFLDADTTVLTFHPGEDSTIAWVATRRGLHTHRLGIPKADLDTLGRNLLENLAHSDESLRRAQAEAEATLLSQHLLAPIWPDLQGRRLVVVGGGGLASVPFSVLPIPGTDQPLADRFEVSYLPSISALPFLRRPSALAPEAPRVAVLADPIFDPNDPRLSVAAAPAPATGALAEAQRDFDLEQLRRLEHTATEARAILSRVPENQRLAALAFDATRDLVTSGALTDIQYLHFATHGLLNDQHPSLSGIVLSLYGPDGKPKDGFLRPHDIEFLELSADLVVLSACQTAFGEEIPGEGIVGLAHAFFSAGARRLVVSHWNVDDAATAALMTEFYKALLTDGQNPAAALRQARESIRRQPQWESPYYWAAFSLRGDWQ